MSESLNTDKINLLPEHIIDQIKAGEVIERPATLLKELLENSVDARSTKISIHIINMGLDLISVEDNGVGISYDDLPLAFCRHATSKIDNFEDLYKLYTYGFRGEALASMASVSKVTCTSNKIDRPKGTLRVHGGEVLSQTQENNTLTKSGTGIFVKDLFFNTPVRKKFLQSQTSERNQLKKILNAFILTHPEIEFAIKWDEGLKEVFPIVTNLEERIKKIFEKKRDPLELIHFESEYDNSEMEMYLSLNSSKGHAGKFQYIFINGRYVQDIQIHKIILNSAQSLWPFGQSGNYIIFLNIDPHRLDVNVHPNKTVIKLFAANAIFSLVSSSIKRYLPKSNQNSKFMPSQANLDLERDMKNFKGINYKSQDFTSENSLQNYFEGLDKTQSAVESSILFKFKDKDASLVSIYSDLYVVDNKLFFINMVETLFEKSINLTPTPLLVSSPLNLTKKIQKSRLDKIQSMGFELDFFDESTLVLRAFPQMISSLPVETILKMLIDNKTILNDKNINLNRETQIDFIPSVGNIEDSLELCGLTNLTQKKVIKKISGKEMLKLL
jgi:DNA mismatch repair protein MutL